MGKKLGISISISRAVGIAGLKSKIAQKTGIPLTIGGLQRKVGRIVINAVNPFHK
jgi:hypothetical protein